MTEVRSCTHSSPRRSAPTHRRSRLELDRSHHTALDSARSELFMCANDPITAIDFQGHYLDANEAACRLLGYSLEELRTCTAQQINRVSDEVWEAVVASTAEAPYRMAETVYYTRHGDAIPVEVNVRRVAYLGRPAILSVARDITRRKAAEAQLVQYNLRLSSLASDAAKLARPLAASTPVAGPLERSISEFVREARDLVPFDSVCVALCVAGTQWLTVYMNEEAGERVACERALIRTPANLESLPQAQAMLLPEGAAMKNLEAPFCANGHGTAKKGIVVPLRVGGRLLGLLSVGRSGDRGFTRLDADALQMLANQLAVAIDCCNLLDGILALAVYEERLRLSREMHDHVGQSMACASAFASDATAMLATGRVNDADWAVAQACKALQQAQSDLRECISAFRTSNVAPEQWVESLREFVTQYERQWGIRCRLHVGEGAAEACGAQGRVGLARIVQEALANVRKHADTKWASVSIVLEDGAVLARIADEGQGFDPSTALQGHYGLQTMRERACGLGGDLTIASGRAGTQLSVRLPASCRL